MKQNCKAIVSHISRLEGQLRRLKVDIEENQSCESIVQLALSSAKSFDSLRAKIIEAYIQEHFLHGTAINVQEHKELESLYTLIKA